MKELMIYIAQVSLLAACSYIIYTAIFARDTLHRTKRFVLLLILAASFALPLCRITVDKAAAPEAMTVAAVVASEISAPPVELIGQAPVILASTLDFFLIAGMIYFAGVVFLLAYRLAGVARVRKIMRRAVSQVVHNGRKVLLVEGDIPPFSFAGRIVLSESDYKENSEMIIRHEEVHIREHHGLDLAVINIVLALLWFNPFVWLLRRELVLVHELAADRGVILSGIDAKKYQYLLISKSACTGDLLPVANHFRTGDLRKRIMFMKRKTSRLAGLNLLLILPLAAVALAAFAETRYIFPEPETTDAVSGEEQFHMPFDVTGAYFAPFGERVHPVTGLTTLHTGIDVVPSNDTIRAPYSGVVKSAAYDKGMGYKLVIAHSNGLETVYGHLAGFLVAEGEAVKGGEPVAIVGDTGLAKGKHLHFETLVNGKHVDPTETLPLDFKIAEYQNRQ